MFSAIWTEVRPSIVRYDWEEGDTDVVGVCDGELVVTFSEAPAEDGASEEGLSKEFTFPAKGDFEIRFRERLTT